MFDNAISAIYSAAAAPDLWPAALDAIAACYDGAGAVIALNRAEGQWSSIVSPALAEAAKDYDSWAWKLDFCMQRGIEKTVTSPSACFTDRLLATPEEILTHPFYTQFRARHGLGPYLACQILPGASVFAVLSLQGKAIRRTFTDDEIESFAALGSHAERSLMLTVKLLEAETRSKEFADVLTRLSCGIILLDADGRIVFENEAARRMFGSSRFPEDGHPSVNAPQRKLIDEAIRAAGCGLEAGISKPPFPILLTSAGANIALYFLPVGQAVPSAIRETFLESRVLILAIEHNPAQPADPLIVRALLGLSQGEARLASLIGSGKSPREAAVQLGITEESARTVLKRVFFKTSTSRQSELAALLSRLPLAQAP